MSIRKRFVRVHRIVYFLETGETPVIVDHIDSNRQNNAIGNLRAADAKENVGNSRISRKNTSGFKGVSRNGRSGLWHAQIKINGKQTYLGRFATPEEAANRYDTAARIHFGDFAKVNYVHA